MVMDYLQHVLLNRRKKTTVIMQECDAHSVYVQLLLLHTLYMCLIQYKTLCPISFFDRIFNSILSETIQYENREMPCEITAELFMVLRESTSISEIGNGKSQPFFEIVRNVNRKEMNKVDNDQTLESVIVYNFNNATVLTMQQLCFCLV